MGKKNTLLYLDEELVQLAKGFEINMSEVAEVAIREKVFPLMSAGGRALLFDLLLEDLKKNGECFTLPCAVKGVRLKNVGPLEELDAKFVRGVNLVLGGNASGKSSLICAIACAMGQSVWRPPSVTLDKKQMAVEIELFEPMAGAEPDRCILLDEPLARVADPDEKHKAKFVQWLSKKYQQAIIASTDKSYVVSNIVRLRAKR